MFENQQKLYYSRTVSDAEASQLAEVLKQAKWYVGNHGVAAHVRREQGRVIVSFPVIEGTWNRPDPLSAFQQLRATIAQQAFAGEAVDVRLCNLRWVAKRMVAAQ